MSRRFSSIVLVAVFTFILSTTANAEILFAYLEGRQEVPPAATSARGYARVFIDETTMQITYTVVFQNLSSTQTASHIHAPAPIGANAGVIINFGAVGGTSGTITGTAAITAAQITQLRQNQGYVNVHTDNFPGGEIRGQLAKKRPVDFDGDGRQDLSVMRFPGTGATRPINFWNLNSYSGNAVISPAWGDALRDFPVPGDYDGDGMDDYALFRAGATAGAQSEFWILTTGTNTVLYYAWGTRGTTVANNFNPSDMPMARDYDGDGITDVAVVRRGATTGDPVAWYIRQSSNNTARVIHWGITGASNNAFFDAPLAGDFDGDGKFDPAIFRFGTPPDHTFIVLKSSDNQPIYRRWGNFQSDYILPGDYDGDGLWDYAAARTGAAASSPLDWWILHGNGTQRFQRFGITSDSPVQGDYDGDGRTDIAVYRPGLSVGAAGNFWILNSFDNTTTIRQWGLNPDFPVAMFDAR